MVNPFTNPSYLMPPLIAFVASLILITLVLRGTRRSFSDWLFCGLLLGLGLWGLLLFGMRSSPDLHHALIWDRGLPAAFCLTFVLYYHFTLTYTNASGQRPILLISYLFVVVILALTPTDLMVERMRMEYYGYAPVIGPALVPVSIGGVLLMGGAAYNLVKRYKASSSCEERNRLLYLIIALLFPLTGAFLDAFSNLPPAAIWGNLIFCILCSIAILKYHLLDIRIVARKSLVYLLISSGIAIPYVSLLYFLHYIFEPALGPLWIHALIILLLAIILRPLYSSAQQLVDRLLYRDRYDYLRALQQFSHQAQSIVNLEELGSNMVQLVSNALRTSSACLLRMSESGKGLVIVSCVGLDRPPPRIVLRKSNPLVKWLELHGNIISSEQLDIVPQLQSFSLKEKHTLEQMGAELYVPMITRRGQLSGILVLGRKLSQQSYSGEDRQLLRAVGNQMAIALDNARLYDETRESEEELRLMYESMGEGITVSDLDGNIVQVNEAVTRMHGFDNKGELIGRSAFELIAKKDRARAMENLKRALEDGYVKDVGYTFLRKNGDEFPAELSTTVLRDVSGNPTGFVAITEDVTEHMQAEEREKQLQQQLYLSGRLASIGELAAGVAHEINNPLTGILGYSERLLRKSTDESARQDLERIHNETRRAARVVENLLTFARRRELKKECLNIDDVLQKALEMRIYELKTSNIGPPVMADFHQIQQVFLNIIVNAEQAMTEADRRGRLLIKTQEEKGYIRITFADDGPGIPDENLDKLFDPFFTTRGERGGTGLGLSICHGIVTEHGGKIYARSKLGEGTTFFVELPLATEKIAESKVPKKEPICRSK